MRTGFGLLWDMSMAMSGFTRRSGENPGRSGLRPCRAMMDLPSRDHRDRTRERLDGIPSGLHRRSAADATSILSLWAGEIAMREAKQPPLSIDSELGRAMIERIMQTLPGLRTSRSSPALAFGSSDRIVNPAVRSRIMEFDNSVRIGL